MYHSSCVLYILFHSHGLFPLAKCCSCCSYIDKVTAAFCLNNGKHEPGASVAVQQFSLSQELARDSPEGASERNSVFVLRWQNTSEERLQIFGSYLRDRRTSKAKRYFNISLRSPLRPCLKNVRVSMAVAVSRSLSQGAVCQK